MKLTKSLRAVIARQFMLGDSINYLAGIYGFTDSRIEAVIRDWMVASQTPAQNQRQPIDGERDNQACHDAET